MHEDIMHNIYLNIEVQQVLLMYIKLAQSLFDYNYLRQDKVNVLCVWVLLLIIQNANKIFSHFSARLHFKYMIQKYLFYVV